MALTNIILPITMIILIIIIMISTIYIFFSLSEVTFFMFNQQQQRPTNKLIKLYNHNDLDNHFESFCLKYYNQNCSLAQKQDYEFRKQIFNKTMARINKLNAMYNNGRISFVSDFNQFSALTLDELKMYLGGSNINRSNNNNNNNVNIISNKSIPKSIDWRLKNNNILNGIKNQANCSISWIFSAISNIEAIITIATNKQIILSEQNILDCYHINNNITDNCQNNNNVQPNDVFNYLVTNPIDFGGLTYPYIGKDTHTCMYNESNGSGVKVTNIVELKPGEINILNGLALNGPISVNYEVFSDYFHYKSGVYVKLNDSYLIGMHSSLLVGYGVKDNSFDLDYFILKNSWSHWWGMDGFGLIGRNIKGLNETKGMCIILISWA